MRKAMKRFLAFVLALTVFMTSVNWSFVSERTEAEMNYTSTTYTTESEMGASQDKEVPVYTLPPQTVSQDVVTEEVVEIPDWTITYENEEVKVTVSGAEGVVPEGTTVKVMPILANDANTQSQYEEVAAQLQGTVEGRPYEIVGFLAYDITLLNAEGNEIEPNGDVKVSMEYVKAVLPEGLDEETASKALLSVHHLVEDEKGKVQEVVDLSSTGSENQALESLQLDDAQAIEKAEFVTDSFSTYTITWTKPDPDKVLKVRLVINGVDHWGLVNAQYNDDTSDDTSGLKNTNYTTVEFNDIQNINAQTIYDAIKNDPFLQGTKLIGMQLGTYNPNEVYDEGVSYINAISYNNGWTYNPKAGGGWYDPAVDDDFNKDDPYVSLVLDSYLEVHVVDSNGNPIALQNNNLPTTVQRYNTGDNRGNITVHGWDLNNGICYLQFPHAVAAGGTDLSAAGMAEAIAGNTALSSYVYTGSALNTYSANTTLGAHLVSFNCTANGDRTWKYGNNGNWAGHWTTAGGEYPKLYLVYQIVETKILNVVAIEAETGKELDRYQVKVTGDSATAASYFDGLMQNQNATIKADYTYVGTQVDDYDNFPRVGEWNDNQRTIWATNIGYNLANNAWSYALSNNGNFTDWTTGDEATICLIYDKNEELTEAETIMNPQGLTVRLFNYSNRANIILSSNGSQNNNPSEPYLGGWNNGGGNLAIGTTNNGAIKYDIVDNVLGSDGYPVTLDRTAVNGTLDGKAGLSLAPLFSLGEEDDPELGIYYQEVASGNIISYDNVNGLFRKDLYENTGYYSYSCFENYAYFDEFDDNGDGKQIVLYNQIGTPLDRGGVSGGNYSNDNEKEFYYRRGNFMPFNTISSSRIALRGRNWYMPDGNVMDPNYINTAYATAEKQKRYGETLYVTEGSNDYHFGMYLEANFYQPANGQVENPVTGELEDMIYNFNGDDDLWLYIDNVLALDIGGIHDAHDGHIDFSTGDIWWTDCGSRQTVLTFESSIVEQFREAGIFPDGSTWDDSKISNYFKNVGSKEVTDCVTGKKKTILTGTFNDYTTHTMKMFYMERGEGASNLQLEFNLKIIPEKTIEITKNLVGDTQQRYSDVVFPIQVWAQKEIAAGSGVYGDYSDEYETVATAQYKDQLDADGNPIALEPHTVTVNGVTYENVFYIKANETIQFMGIAENQKYRVVELKLDETKYEQAQFTVSEGQVVLDEYGNYTTEPLLAAQQIKLTITNTCKTDDFELQKVMKEGQVSTDSFTFKVWVENLSGILVPYSGNYSINGTAMQTENGEISIKAGEIAKFEAFLIGTRFYVEEIQLGRAYATPEKVSNTTVAGTLVITDLEGVTEVTPDGAVTKDANSNVTVTITNQYKPSVSVTKEWNDVEADRTRDQIYVGLYERFNNGGTEEERYADQYAVLNAENNWSYTWQYLEPNKTYVVKEFRKAEANETVGIISLDGISWVPMTEGETIIVSDVKYHVDYSDAVATTDATTGAPVNSVTIANAVVWKFLKTGLGPSNQQYTAPLAGATFVLKNADETKKYIGVSGEDGIITWNVDGGTEKVVYIPDGAYTFQEVQAPAGYLLNTDVWTVTVEKSVPTITCNGENVGNATVDSNSHELLFEFHNSPMYDLPSSGAGNGTFGIFGYVAGGILVMLAAVMLVFKSRGKRSILEK